MVQDLKDQILIEAGGDPNNSDQKFKEDNLDIATRIMVEKGEGKKLLTALTNYKRDLLAIDKSIDSAFKTSLPINLDKPASKNKAAKNMGRCILSHGSNGSSLDYSQQISE